MTTQPAADTGWDPGPHEERAPEFPSLEEFTAAYLFPLMRRRLGGHLTWCPKWWLHEEAITRLMALWYSWEHYRYEGPTGLSDWLLHHADPHMAVLMSKDNGPFMACTPARHSAQAALPSDNPPPGTFSHPAYQDLPPAGS